MEYKLVLTQVADEDTCEALLYYGGINTLLADRFYDELLEIYDKLSKAPQYYSYCPSRVPNTIRDVRLPTFPYLVVFEIVDNLVYIIAVMNCNRKPRVY